MVTLGTQKTNVEMLTASSVFKNQADQEANRYLLPTSFLQWIGSQRRNEEVQRAGLAEPFCFEESISVFFSSNLFGGQKLTRVSCSSESETEAKGT